MLTTRWQTRILCLAAIAALSGLLPAAASDEGVAASKLRGLLAGVVERARPGELIPVSIVLADQLTGERLRAIGAELSERDARRRVRVAALKEHARRTQAGLLEVLYRAREEGRARRIRPLWLSNVVAAELTREEILEVAARPEVAWVNWEPKRDVYLGPRECAVVEEDPLDGYRGEAPLADDIECGVELLRAPELWEDFGDTGEGAIVAVIDGGVCWRHSDIEHQVWVNPGEDLDGDGEVMDPDDENGVDDDGNGYVDDLIGYDISAGDNDPDDEDGHGSHCAGTVAGDGTAGFQAGMAPDAKIMVLRAGLTLTDEPAVWEAMEYAAMMGADAISMSLGWSHDADPDRATWRTNCENTIDLGTAMIVAAGNDGAGNEPYNVTTPGNVPRVITVGAVDCDDNLADFSSRGPVTWEDVPPWNDWPYPPGLVKPDVVAPGVDTRSHDMCEGYKEMSGTSMATPHVAGAVALMIARNPALTHDDIKEILEETAVDLGDPGKDNDHGAGRVDAYEAVARSASSDGTVHVAESHVSCADVLHVAVSDEDLQGDGTVDVTITSNTEPDGEVVTLTETNEGSGVFRGEIEVVAGNPVPDGRIQVSHGDDVVAHYVDADDGNGHEDVEKTDTTRTDCQYPIISWVHDENADLDSVEIVWTTDEESDSLVTWGSETPPDRQEHQPRKVKEHRIRLEGLEECTVYWYEVASADPLGHRAEDDNGGTWYHVETLGDFGQGPQPCHAGRTTLDRESYGCSDTVSITVTDRDLNQDPGAVERVTVEVTSTVETEPELVELVETDVDSSRFTGSISTDPGSVAHDGRIQVKDGATVSVVYRDADDGTGAPALSWDDGRIDCAGPVIRDLRVIDVTDQRLTISWTTDEPADTVVDWGHSPDQLDRTVSSPELRTIHRVTLNDFADMCDAGYFRVHGTDELGNETVVDLQGEPYECHTGTIPGLYWRATFENGAPGWTLEGEWETGEPQGLGCWGGQFCDPDRAYNNEAALGHDLTGQGAFPGAYEPLVVESAYTPWLDATTWHDTKLLFYRHLHCAAQDEASILVWTIQGLPIWRSDGAQIEDPRWVQVTHDLSSVDGWSQVRIEFRQQADPDVQHGGWTIDDVILKDGSLPDYGPCESCGGAPAFDGADSATDDDACGASGVTVSWHEAVAWGTADGGTYAVYRSTDPDFVPGPDTLVASGITGTSWHDDGAPEDADLWYVVRAETDETCGTGPANGGVMDDNLVRVHVEATTSRPEPGPVSGLVVELVGDVHVRLTWQPATDASAYRVYRGTGPRPEDFVLLGETAETHWDDLDEGGNAKTWFYEVVAINPCGTEGD